LFGRQEQIWSTRIRKPEDEGGPAMNGAELTSISLTILLLGFVIGMLAGSRM